MTTRILVINHGPDPVEVRSAFHTPTGHLSTAPLGVVPPQAEGSFYVYPGQQLLVTEIEKGTT